MVEYLERAVTISSFVSGGAFLSGLSLGGGENGFFVGKRLSKRTTFIGWGVSAPGWDGKRGGVGPKANLLALQRDWGVALSRKDDQCLFLAVLIALKYPALEMLATSRRAGVPCFLTILEALWNSRRRVVRWGDHHSFE